MSLILEYLRQHCAPSSWELTSFTSLSYCIYLCVKSFAEFQWLVRRLHEFTSTSSGEDWVTTFNNMDMWTLATHCQNHSFLVEDPNSLSSGEEGQFSSVLLSLLPNVVLLPTLNLRIYSNKHNAAIQQGVSLAASIVGVSHRSTNSTA